MASTWITSWDDRKCLQNISALIRLSRPSQEAQAHLSDSSWWDRLCKTPVSLKTKITSKGKTTCTISFCSASPRSLAYCIANDFALYLQGFPLPHDNSAVSHRLTTTAPRERLSGPFCMKHTQLLPSEALMCWFTESSWLTWENESGHGWFNILWAKTQPAIVSLDYCKHFTHLHTGPREKIFKILSGFDAHIAWALLKIT